MDLPLDPVQVIRSATRGVLHIADPLNESIFPVRFIIDPASGRFIAPVAAPAGASDAATLFIPDEGDDSAQVHVAIEWIADPSLAAECDRWCAYHGRLQPGHYGRLNPLGFRLAGRVYDVDQVDLRNPLAASNSRLVRLANADLGVLAKAAARFAGGAMPGATCVGVDHLGMDVRGPLGVLRIQFVTAATTEEQVVETVRLVLQA